MEVSGMNKYYVLSTDSYLIKIEADDYEWDYECGVVAFNNYVGSSKKVVGMFQIPNIVGVYDITEENR